MTMTFLIVIVVIVLALVALANLLFQPSQSLYQYKKKNYIMTQAEKRCFDALVQSVGATYYIFPQIHLPNLLEHKVRGQNWRGAFRHIDEKSVDFVLCDKDKVSPILAIELDDWSHDREDRQLRDREVERIFKDAGLPLLRLKPRDSFDIAELSKEIAGSIDGSHHL